MANNYVVISGRDVPLHPGDSPERMQRVAQYVDGTIAENDVRNQAHGRKPDDLGRMLEAALELGDQLFMAQDENTRLRKMLTGVREHVFKLERENDDLKHGISAMRKQLDAMNEKSKANEAHENMQ